MMKKLFYILALFYSTILWAQIPQDTIMYEGRHSANLRLPMYIVNNNTYYQWQWDKRNKTYMLYKDTLQITPQNLYINECFYMDKQANKIYYGGEKCFSFDFNNDSSTSFIVPLEFADDFVIADGKLYYSNHKKLSFDLGSMGIDDNVTEMFILDLSSEQIIDSVDIGNKIFYVVFKIIKFPNTNNVLFGYANYSGGEIENENYYEYDEINKKWTLSEKNDEIKQTLNPNSFINILYDFTGKYLFLRGYIMNSDYTFYSKILDFNINVLGYVLVNKEIKQIIVHSNLDAEGVEVLIPFIPNPFKEKSMYEIYANIELNAQDLQRFDAFDLLLLRNMIFAKHNYAFKSKFLQAYFNLYSFYRSGQNKTRLTNVSHLLTAVDNKNLDLIQQVENTKKEEK